MAKQITRMQLQAIGHKLEILAREHVEKARIERIAKRKEIEAQAKKFDKDLEKFKKDFVKKHADVIVSMVDVDLYTWGDSNGLFSNLTIDRSHPAFAPLRDAFDYDIKKANLVKRPDVDDEGLAAFEMPFVKNLSFYVPGEKKDQWRTVRELILNNVMENDVSALFDHIVEVLK